MKLSESFRQKKYNLMDYFVEYLVIDHGHLYKKSFYLVEEAI